MIVKMTNIPSVDNGLNYKFAGKEMERADNKEAKAERKVQEREQEEKWLTESRKEHSKLGNNKYYLDGTGAKCKSNKILLTPPPLSVNFESS